MALTERERHLLQSLERQMSTEDAGFANRFARSQQSLDYPRTGRRIGAARLAVIGLMVLVLGTSTGLGVLGAAGFFLMVTGLLAVPGVLSFPHRGRAESHDG